MRSDVISEKASVYPAWRSFIFYHKPRGQQEQAAHFTLTISLSNHVLALP